MSEPINGKVSEAKATDAMKGGLIHRYMNEPRLHAYTDKISSEILSLVERNCTEPDGGWHHLQDDIKSWAVEIVEAANTYASLLARNKKLVEVLKDYQEFILDNFGEFAGPCNPDNEGLCPKCESNGCISMKIAKARAALTEE